MQLRVQQMSQPPLARNLIVIDEGCELPFGAPKPSIPCH
jgi:hypothetical protein